MDRQLLERMVGAGVLVLALVIITPALLDGNRTESRVSRTAPLPENGGEMRTHTIRPDTQAKRPPVARDVVVPAETGSVAGSGRETGNAVKSGQTSGSAKAPPVKESRTEPKPVSKQPSSPSPKATTGVAKPAPAKPAARASAPPPAKSAPNTGAGWVVQLGSFASRKNAQGLVDSVAGKGFSSYLLPLARSGQKTLYRVRVGPPADRSKAERLVSDLKKAGYPGQVVKQ